MKFWKKIKRIIFGPHSEIGFVEASLEKHEDKLFKINSSFDAANHCCQDCMTGGYYSRLIDKIERIREQLDNLKSKERKR